MNFPHNSNPTKMTLVRNLSYINITLLVKSTDSLFMEKHVLKLANARDCLIFNFRKVLLEIR